MQALATCPSGDLLHRRSTNISYRPCMAGTLLPRLSTAAATVRPASHPQFSFVLRPSSLTAHAGRSAILSSALPSGFTQLNFLEVVSTEVTPASPRYLTDTGRHHSQQLEQSLCALADAVSEEEHEEIVAALQTSDAKRRLSQASTNVGGFSVKHASVIAKRISKHPFFQGCTRFKTRGRLQGAGHKPSPHQDPTANRKELYKYRVVLRFSADGHSPSHIDFYIPRLKDNGRFKFANVSGPDASLEIPSGQGYIMSGGIGLRGEGNTFFHDVPPSFNGVSLIIDFF